MCQSIWTLKDIQNSKLPSLGTEQKGQKLFLGIAAALFMLTASRDDSFVGGSTP